MFLPFGQDAKRWEPHAVRLRGKVHMRPDQIIFDPFALAPKVGLTVQPVSFTGLTADEQRHLRGDGRNHWSGGIFPQPLPDGTRLCMLNPDDSDRRNRITLMEEICHAYFNHAPTRLIATEPGVFVREFNATQEKDAYGVGAAVLLPWSLFYHRINDGTSIEQIAEEFDVTTHLVQYRIKITGGSRLYSARVKRTSARAAGL